MYARLRMKCLGFSVMAITTLYLKHPQVDFVSNPNFCRGIWKRQISHCEASHRTDSESISRNTSQERQKLISALQSIFPNTSESDIVRFLVARNWNLEQASAMLTQALAWHSSNFPLSMHRVNAVLAQNCFLSHGLDREGSPVLYFRWGLYDSSKASPEQYMLTIGHLLDYALECSGASKVVVYVDLSVIEGGTNAYADMELLRHIIQCSSDNYPERLKHLILYPMPWYGMAVWKCLQIFVDQRSQEKLKFIPKCGSSKSLPGNIVELINPDVIPHMFGGNFMGPLVDLRTTFTKI